MRLWFALPHRRVSETAKAIAPAVAPKAHLIEPLTGRNLLIRRRNRHVLGRLPKDLRVFKVDSRKIIWSKAVLKLALRRAKRLVHHANVGTNHHRCIEFVNHRIDILARCVAQQGVVGKRVGVVHLEMLVVKNVSNETAD